MTTAEMLKNNINTLRLDALRAQIDLGRDEVVRFRDDLLAGKLFKAAKRAPQSKLFVGLDEAMADHASMVGKMKNMMTGSGARLFALSQGGIVGGDERAVQVWQSKNREIGRQALNA